MRRGADGAAFRHAEPSEEGLGVGIGMAARGDGNRRINRRADTDRPAGAGGEILPLRPCPGGAAPQQAEGRGEHHPRHRAVRLDEGEIDGELRAAGEEFLRAVERIDQQEALGQRGGRGGIFLAHHRDPRQGGGKAGQQDALGGKVRLGQRAAVRLGVGEHAGAPDGQDRLPRCPGEIGEQGQERGGGKGHRNLLARLCGRDSLCYEMFANST